MSRSILTHCHACGEDFGQPYLAADLDFDALEAAAVRAITNTYGPMLDDEVRGWIQTGIDGMRNALATGAEGA